VIRFVCRDRDLDEDGARVILADARPPTLPTARIGTAGALDVNRAAGDEFRNSSTSRRSLTLPLLCAAPGLTI